MYFPKKTCCLKDNLKNIFDKEYSKKIEISSLLTVIINTLFITLGFIFRVIYATNNDIDYQLCFVIFFSFLFFCVDVSQFAPPTMSCTVFVCPGMTTCHDRQLKTTKKWQMKRQWCFGALFLYFVFWIGYKTHENEKKNTIQKLKKKQKKTRKQK